MEEQLAQYVRELQSSAFTRKRSTETRSRSARNATQSFLSKMAFFWKKKNEKVRIQKSVPSFFTPIGDAVRASGPKSARKACEENKPCAVVFPMTPDVCSARNSWASALSSASYLVVIGNPADRESKLFMKALDCVIFSPVPRRLSSAFIVSTREEALDLIEGVSSTFPRVITIIADSTESEED